mgnify:CR=1 FL=1
MVYASLVNMIIDFHTHIFPPSFEDKRSDYLSRDATLAALYSNSDLAMASAEDLVSTMDEARIEKSVVMGLGWTDLEVAKASNDYILNSAARYDGRLIPFCSVNPAWGEMALKEIENNVASGARGVGELHPDTQGFSFSDSVVMDPFMNLLRSYDVILVTHASEPVGHQYPGKGTITPSILMSLIDMYPEVNIVCSHWGGGLPIYRLMPEVDSALSNVYFDSAASPFLYRASIYSVMSRIARPGSILFGSDYPLLNPQRLIRHIRAADISDEEKSRILGGNANNLLGLDAV